MSRIGKKIIHIPTSIVLTNINNRILITGPYGTVSYMVPPCFHISYTSTYLELILKPGPRKAHEQALYGVTRTLLANMITGVSTKFRKVLLFEGLGFKAKFFDRTEKVLNLTLGFSHSINVVIPSDIEIIIENAIKLIIVGIDKVKVHSLAAKIRALKVPEPYNGKGIQYEGEKIRRKLGKSIRSVRVAVKAKAINIKPVKNKK